MEYAYQINWTCLDCCQKLKNAVKFYQEVVGLKLIDMNEQWGWAEFEGHEGEGARLGVAQQNFQQPEPIQPGQNAVMTFSVENLEKASKNLSQQGAILVGQVQEILGHVKLQTVKDNEGNYFQLVQDISADVCFTSSHGCGCH